MASSRCPFECRIGTARQVFLVLMDYPYSFGIGIGLLNMDELTRENASSMQYLSWKMNRITKWHLNEVAASYLKPQVRANLALASAPDLT